MGHPKVTLITPTGCRPSAFALCEKWIARQTFQNFNWIVVDDGELPTPTTMGQIVVRVEPLWRPGDNTQCRNLRAGIVECPFVRDILFFIEDDDWYAPAYLDVMLGALGDNDMIGIGRNAYYHMRRLYHKHGNTEHASLCATAIHRRVIPHLLAAMDTGKWAFDMHLWRQPQGLKRKVIFDELVLGMKGMPGRGGICPAHDAKAWSLWKPDPDLSWLRSYIGDDVNEYLPFLEKQPCTANE